MVRGSHSEVRVCTGAGVLGSNVAAFPGKGGDVGRATVDGCATCPLRKASG